jgi:hypothetical protein
MVTKIVVDRIVVKRVWSVSEEKLFERHGTVMEDLASNKQALATTVLTRKVSSDGRTGVAQRGVRKSSRQRTLHSKELGDHEYNQCKHLEH